MGGWNKSFWGAGEPSKAHKCVEREEVPVCLSIRKAREMHRLLLGVTEGKLKASNGSPGGFKVCGYLQGQVNQSVLRNPAHSRAGLCWYLGLGKILHTWFYMWHSWKRPCHTIIVLIVSGSNL